MSNLFLKTFKITNNSIILTIPLIIGVKMLDLYSVFTKYTVDSLPKFFLASLTMLFMFGVLSAAWFYIVKEAVNLSKKVFVFDKDRANATFSLFKLLPEGIGKFFLSFVGVYIIFFFIQILLTPLVYFLGINLIGDLDATSMQAFYSLASDPNVSTNAGMTKFVESLTPEMVVYLGKWCLLFMAVTSVVMFLLMLWIPEIMYNTPNAFVALWRSVVKLFKDFVCSLKLYLSIWLSGFVLLFVSSFAVLTPFTYLVMSVVLFYFSVYFVLLVFVYYDKKYVSQDEK